ncbi:unnamed protein product, partial [Prorocentrum cordatum]
ALRQAAGNPPPPPQPQPPPPEQPSASSRAEDADSARRPRLESPPQVETPPETPCSSRTESLPGFVEAAEGQPKSRADTMRALFTGRDLGTKSLPLSTISRPAKDCRLDARALKQSHGGRDGEDEEEEHDRLLSWRLSWLHAGAAGPAGGAPAEGGSAAAAADAPPADPRGGHGEVAAPPPEADEAAPAEAEPDDGPPTPAGGGAMSLALPEGSLALAPPDRNLAVPLGTVPSLPPQTPGGASSRAGGAESRAGGAGEGGKTVRSPKSRDGRRTRPPRTRSWRSSSSSCCRRRPGCCRGGWTDSGQFQPPDPEGVSPKATPAQRKLPKGAQVSSRRHSTASMSLHLGVRAPVMSGRSSMR